MAFGSLSAGERLRVLLDLQGAAEYISKMSAATKATLGFSEANKAARMSAYEANLVQQNAAQGFIRSAAATKELTHRTWLQNQAMYTARRYAFYATLAFTALAYSVIKLGFEYNNALQTAKVALGPLFRVPGSLDKIINRLYVIAALSPFLFKDMTVAFRTMYPAFKQAGLSASLTVTTLKRITDAMSLAGRTAPGQLNRVSVALQHMALMGRPLGFTVTQLDRLGVPFSAALKAKFHYSAEQLHNIASSGLTAKQAIQALNEYIAKTPGYKNAAERLANSTLSGAWAQFKDILSQASGRSTGGLFTGLQKTLKGINESLQPLFKANKPIGIDTLVRAIDSQLTPSTHIIINLFQLFKGVLQGLAFEIYTLFKVISLVLRPLSSLLSIGRMNERVFRALGYVTAILITLWAAGRVRALYMALAEERMFKWAARLVITTWGEVTSMWAWVVSTYAAAGAMGVLTGAVRAFWIAMGPIGWLILAIGAFIVLYTKWKGFRDQVNNVWPVAVAGALAFLGPLGMIAGALLLIIHYQKQIEEFWATTSHPSSAWAAIKSNNPITNTIHLLSTGHRHAQGGMTGSGVSMVGENGPELAVFPRNTRIIPNSQIGHTLSNAGMPIVEVHVYPQDINIDKQKIGEVISTVKTDTRARA